MDILETWWILLVSLIILCIIGAFVFVYPLINFHSKLSKNSDDEIYPNLLELNKTIITISSATIALSVSFINSTSTVKGILAVSWIFFIFSIGFGVFILLLSYYKKNISVVLLQTLQSCLNTDVNKLSEKDKTDYDNNLKLVDKLFVSKKLSYIFLILFVYAQSFSFIIALIFLIISGYELM